MVKLLKIVPKKFDNENRDKRELSVVKELGHEVIVMAKGDINEIKTIDGFEVHCRITKPLGNNKLIIGINRLASLFTWALYARKIKPDCISGHDLIGLFIGWLSTLFISKNKRPLLVYDSHEFELGRNTFGKKNKFTRWRISVVERFLMSKCTFNMMVNDSIADEVQKIHSTTDRPVVVRNIPSYWNIDEEVCKEKRKEICGKFGISSNTFLIMYHGGIARGRGIENLIQANKLLDDTVVVILGYGQIEYINELKKLINKHDMKNKVFFIEAVPSKILWKYVGSADIGVTLAPNTCTNHYLMLPNKLFENIQSLTPIIGSDFPEIKRIIQGYDIGICCDPHDINSIKDSINKLKEDKNLYMNFKKNLRTAKEELTWENEKKVLVDVYLTTFNLIEKRKNDMM